jgi:hypothetical protein
MRVLGSLPEHQNLDEDEGSSEDEDEKSDDDGEIAST